MILATIKKSGDNTMSAMQEKIISNTLFQTRHQGFSPIFCISITGIFPINEISVLIFVVSKKFARYR